MASNTGTTIRRSNYRDGEVLAAEQLRVDQDYIKRDAELINGGVAGHGILTGLEVSSLSGDAAVIKIEAGTALIRKITSGELRGMEVYLHDSLEQIFSGPIPGYQTPEESVKIKVTIRPGESYLETDLSRGDEPFRRREEGLIGIRSLEEVYDQSTELVLAELEIITDSSGTPTGPVNVLSSGRKTGIELPEVSALGVSFASDEETSLLPPAAIQAEIFQDLNLLDVQAGEITISTEAAPSLLEHRGDLKAKGQVTVHGELIVGTTGVQFTDESVLTTAVNPIFYEYVFQPTGDPEDNRIRLQSLIGNDRTILIGHYVEGLQLDQALELKDVQNLNLIGVAYMYMKPVVGVSLKSIFNMSGNCLNVKLENIEVRGGAGLLHLEGEAENLTILKNRNDGKADYPLLESASNSILNSTDIHLNTWGMNSGAAIRIIETESQKLSIDDNKLENSGRNADEALLVIASELKLLKDVKVTSNRLRAVGEGIQIKGNAIAKGLDVKDNRIIVNAGIETGEAAEKLKYRCLQVERFARSIILGNIMILESDIVGARETLLLEYLSKSIVRGNTLDSGIVTERAVAFRNVVSTIFSNNNCRGIISRDRDSDYELDANLFQEEEAEGLS